MSQTLPFLAQGDRDAGDLRPTTSVRMRRGAELVAITTIALAGAAAVFALFLLLLGKSPVDFAVLVWVGGFGGAFSLQNALQRASPLILTALAFALPARVGLSMIGAEGSFVLGGLAAAAIATPLIGAAPAPVVWFVMVAAALAAGGALTMLAGALRHYRGVNETIASLLLTYIAIAVLNFAVEGPLRDVNSTNRPSTAPIGEAYMIGKIPGSTVHWGLAAGLALAVLFGLLMSRTTFGFAVRIAGANPRAALAQGLPIGRLILTCSWLAGACAGLAGFFEVAAIQGRANAGLAAGYGFTGILISFLARHNPLAIVPVAVLFGGLVASGGLIQRRMDMPDATVLVLQGILFVTLLASETLYGRFTIFQPPGPVER